MLARSLVEKRGKLDQQQLRAFDEAGFVAPQVLEVIAVVAASTMTNYSASVGQPVLEPQFQEYSWSA
jgi:alkylhydroperoxidase family enzyme